MLASNRARHTHRVVLTDLSTLQIHSLTNYDYVAAAARMVLGWVTRMCSQFRELVK